MKIPDRLPAAAEVYWNRRRRLWSVRDAATGRVCAHLPGLTLAAAAFRVGAAGRERARREGRRNVHAWVRGVPAPAAPAAPAARGWVRVRYSPFSAAPHFTDPAGRPVRAAAAVWFGPAGRVLARRPQ